MKYLLNTFFVLMCSILNLLAIKSFDLAQVKTCSLYASSRCIGKYCIGKNLMGCYFNDSYLEDTYFDGVYFYHTDFTGAHLNGAEFVSGSDLNDSDFTDADLSEADLHSSDVSKCNFTNAKLRYAKLYEVKIKGAIVEGADFRGAYGLTSKQKKYLRKNGAINVPVDIEYDLDPEIEKYKEVFDPNDLGLWDAIRRPFKQWFKYHFQSEDAMVQKDNVFELEEE